MPSLETATAERTQALRSAPRLKRSFGGTTKRPRAPGSAHARHQPSAGQWSPPSSDMTGTSHDGSEGAQLVTRLCVRESTDSPGRQVCAKAQRSVSSFTKGVAHALRFLASKAGRARLGLFVTAFTLLLGYGLCRPGVESLFLEDYDASDLPWVWAAVMPAVLGVVAVYRALCRRWSMAGVFLVGLASSGALLVLLLLAQSANLPGAMFALYLWKEIHIVVLLEAFWSFAHLTHGSEKDARWAYGFYLVAGSLGGMAGNQLGGLSAEWIGTWSTLLLTLLPFAALFVATATFRRHLDQAAPLPSKPRLSLSVASKVFRETPFVLLLLALVLVVQVVITLVDYRYNELLEVSFPNLDERTQVKSNVYTIIDGLSLALQLGTGPILKYLGTASVLLLVPALVGSMIGVSALAPRFLVAATSKILAKSFDYSVFRAAKEMLYLPLDYDEKVRGKAVVDMFGYRTGKSGGSLILAGLTTAGLASSWTPVAAAVLAVAWLALTFVVLRNRRHEP